MEARGEIPPPESFPPGHVRDGQTRGVRRLGTLTHCRAIFIKEAQAAFPHGFVTWANRPLSHRLTVIAF